MSIASLILALVPAVAAKTSPKPQAKTKRERELEAEVETLTFALEYQRAAATALHAQNERLIRERDADIARQYAPQLQQYQAMQNAQLAQQAMQSPYYQQLGMQQSSQDYFCTCVPDRASLLLGGA